MRKAKSLDFVITGHENLNNNVDREVGQANNLFEIFKKDPLAKVLVYVGHSHLEKENKSKKWMAQIFKEISNINPITINQVPICSNVNKNLILIPKKYLNDDKFVKSSADYFLVNNLNPIIDNIYNPEKVKQSRIYSDKFSKYKSKEMYIQVFDKKEYDVLKSQSVPITNYLLSPQSNFIDCNLPIGQWKIIIKDENNIVIYDNFIDVN